MKPFDDFMNSWLRMQRYPLLCGATIFILFSGPLFSSFVSGRIVQIINLFLLALAGINLLEHEERSTMLYRMLSGTILLSVILQIFLQEYETLRAVNFTLMFFYFAFVSYLLLRQIIKSEEFTINTIIGAFTGYILLGILGFFLFVLIEVIDPGSFTLGELTWDTCDELLYFSFITLTTIGYGDVSPVNEIAQRFAVVLGLSGQFYLTVVIALLIGKHLQFKAT
jgi:hypothetical protein